MNGVAKSLGEHRDALEADDQNFGVKSSGMKRFSYLASFNGRASLGYRLAGETEQM